MKWLAPVVGQVEIQTQVYVTGKRQAKKKKIINDPNSPSNVPGRSAFDNWELLLFFKVNDFKKSYSKNSESFFLYDQKQEKGAGATKITSIQHTIESTSYSSPIIRRNKIEIEKEVKPISR